MQSVKVEVEHCTKEGYVPRFMELEQLISLRVPTAHVTGISGQSDSFEVMVNGKLIFSKLRCKVFPPNDRVAFEVKRAANGEEPNEIIVTKDSSCCTLL